MADYISAYTGKEIDAGIAKANTALQSLPEHVHSYNTLTDKPTIPAGYAYNLLDNSDFRNPVNQRGATSYTTGGAYTIDRWFNRSGATMTVNNGSITVTGLIKQRLTHAKQDGVYTFAVCAADGVVSILQSHGWDNDAACYYVEFGNGEYIWAALYEGEYTADTLPGYMPKGFAAELAECQRYYIQLANDYSAWMTACNVYGWGVVLTVPAPSGMRATPVLQTLDEGCRVYMSGGWSAVSFTGANVRSNSIMLAFSAVDGMENGLNYLFAGAAALSAEL